MQELRWYTKAGTEFWADCHLPEFHLIRSMLQSNTLTTLKDAASVFGNITFFLLYICNYTCEHSGVNYTRQRLFPKVRALIFPDGEGFPINCALKHPLELLLVAFMEMMWPHGCPPMVCSSTVPGKLGFSENPSLCCFRMF